MTAGKELDALIAEKVMGLGLSMPEAGVPSYSTTITDAWTVIEKLTERGASCYIKAYSKTNSCCAEEYCCTVLNKQQRIQECGDTAAEAICNAAIRWMEDCTDA